jgi:T-complex protein 1 subunit delta
MEVIHPTAKMVSLYPRSNFNLLF